MKKEVGNNLMKQLDKMLNDVYRNDSMHYQQQLMKNGLLMKVILILFSVCFYLLTGLFNFQ